MADAGLAAHARRRVALFALGLAACGPAQGPQPIVYDREPCSHCRMLISEPRFAAQLETQDGEIQSFDDPGCLLAALATRSPSVRALWFHHVRENRWLDAAHVAFEEGERTPMGYGLGAVDAGTARALSLDEARARVAERGARPGRRE
jgi:copper chaperone NosL